MITKIEQSAAQPGDSPQIWSLSDGRAGNARQADALAAALGGAARSLTLEPRAPWRWFAPRGLPGAAGAFGPDFDRALVAPPAVAVGCGRQAALATRLLRGQGAKAVQILDPRIDPRHWDAVIAPAHDGLCGANVITLLGSLHPVDDAWLQRARARFPAVGELPAPRTALLLGGPTANARWDAAHIDRLLGQLLAIRAQEAGSLLATVSRRTPGGIVDLLRSRLDGVPGLLWTGPADGANPYPGLLAWADRIVCSPDSVNMVSEACATRVPVHVFDAALARSRPRRFLEALAARGRLGGIELAPAQDVEPLRETPRVAAEVRTRLGLDAR
ncbi:MULTISPECIES: mitochondrial fission ELM1 family protein [unclassified Luteimonas]